MNVEPTATVSDDGPPDIVIAVIGRGVVGDRVRRRIDLVRAGARVVSIDTREIDLSTTRLLDDVAVAVMVHAGPQVDAVAACVARGVPVVAAGDQVDDVAEMIALDAAARSAGVPVVVGAGMSPGLTSLLARHLAGKMSTVDEIHVAVHGTAGPACARQHHRALAGTSIGWFDGHEARRRSGTGRELVWFPEPVGAYDCYLAELPAPLILRRIFPQIVRASARMSANRRDRLTSRLPMLTRPHREGGVGAVRVEVRGADGDGGRITLVAGIAELVGTAAAATVTAFADLVIAGGLHPGIVFPGEETLDNDGLLRTIGRLGVRLQEFTGVPID